MACSFLKDLVIYPKIPESIPLRGVSGHTSDVITLVNVFLEALATTLNYNEELFTDIVFAKIIPEHISFVAAFAFVLISFVFFFPIVCFLGGAPISCGVDRTGNGSTISFGRA